YRLGAVRVGGDTKAGIGFPGSLSAIIVAARAETGHRGDSAPDVDHRVLHVEAGVPFRDAESIPRQWRRKRRAHHQLCCLRRLGLSVRVVADSNWCRWRGGASRSRAPSLVSQFPALMPDWRTPLRDTIPWSI